VSSHSSRGFGICWSVRDLHNERDRPGRRLHRTKKEVLEVERVHAVHNADPSIHVNHDRSSQPLLRVYRSIRLDQDCFDIFQRAGVYCATARNAEKVSVHTTTGPGASPDLQNDILPSRTGNFPIDRGSLNK
jgi:hypothetical protein